MSKDSDHAEELRTEIVRAIVADTGMRELLAMPIANSVMAYLQSQYAGERIYIPAPSRQYDVMQIQAALERGDSITRVCAVHSVSRSKLYKLFPGGLPQLIESAA